MKKKLIVSFSGGLTSAYMLWWILNNWSQEYEICVVFANTGLEHEGTLEFINACSNYFNVPINWIESVPRTTKGWGVTHKIVSYETASRNGEPFEEMIQLLGIPSSTSPFCSYQLKKLAIESFAKSVEWEDCYYAIGIRGDEIDRINARHKKLRILYPLINKSKKDINDFWANMPFTLKIPPLMGNCMGCWKRSIKDHLSIAKETPMVFDWWQRMTDLYGHINPRNVRLKPPFNFFRGNLGPKDIMAISKLSNSQLQLFIEEQTPSGVCETCEVF